MTEAAGEPKNLLEVAYHKYAGELYRYALMLLAEQSAAEDAVQQAFMKTIRRQGHTEPVEYYDRYLRTAVRNECYRIIKQRRRVKEVGLSHIEPILEAANNQAPNEQERRALEQALRELPADQREVLYLKVYEDRTLKEIGELMGTSLNTTASRYRYAITRLKKILVRHQQE